MSPFFAPLRFSIASLTSTREKTGEMISSLKGMSELRIFSASGYAFSGANTDPSTVISFLQIKLGEIGTTPIFAKFPSSNTTPPFRTNSNALLKASIVPPASTTISGFKPPLLSMKTLSHSSVFPLLKMSMQHLYSSQVFFYARDDQLQTLLRLC